MSKQNIDANQSEILELQAKKFQKEINAGTVSLVLLAIIAQAEEPIYGYQITKRLKPNGDSKQGAIYPVLRNLNAKGLIDCDIKQSESGPPRKYYQISDLGQKVLTLWTENWLATQHQVNNILNGSSNDE
jgi:PadR family transcriptional regulator PadR